MLLTLCFVLAAEQCDDPSNYDKREDLPRIVIGCWQLLERTNDRSAAVTTLKAYTAAGFTAFDTADIYGESESILGRLRSELSADNTAAVPKFFTKYVTQDATEEQARRVNAQSRNALGAVPDIVQFHW